MQFTSFLFKNERLLNSQDIDIQLLGCFFGGPSIIINSPLLILVIFV